MKIVVSTDSFKGSIDSFKMGNIFVDSAKQVSNDIEVLPIVIADGGEGTLDAVLYSGGFKEKKVKARNPFFEYIDAKYGICGKSALIEMAVASGLPLIEYKDGNALYTSSIGTGDLILDAIKNGAKDITVTVGGSATNDGGIGCLIALGYKFLDKDGNPLSGIGKDLEKICTIDTSNAIDTSNVTFHVLCDVDNPLVGEKGATKFYGRQKGAVGEASDQLEMGMLNYASLVQKATGVDLCNLKGAGAAGGLAGALIAFLGAKVMSGIESILDIVDYDKKIQDANLIITGEGRMDDQSACGKAISGVASRAKKYNVPVWAIVGVSRISEQVAAELGISNIFQLIDYAPSADESIHNAEKYAKEVSKIMINKFIKGE